MATQAADHPTGNRRDERDMPERLTLVHIGQVYFDHWQLAGDQREALWALMDCAIAAFHIGDWLRATHVDHHASSRRFAQRSQCIRMTRDICHSAKHGDLQWVDAQAATHGPIVVK